MKTQKQRLAAMMFAVLVFGAGMTPVLANSAALKLIVFVGGIVLNGPPEIYTPMMVGAVVAGFTPLWPVAVGLL